MDNLIFMDSHCRLPQELYWLLSKWFQNQRCVLGLPWWRRTISSSVWHYNWRRRLDHLSEAHVDWESYKKGFGNLEGGVWLGNNYLHRLTASANMLFRTDMEDYEGDRRFAEYTAGDSLVSESKPIKYVISISLSVVCIKNIRLLKREISKFLPPRK